MSISPEYQAALECLRAAGVTNADPTAASLEEARATQQRYFAFLAEEPPPVPEIEDHELQGPSGPLRLRVYYPTGSRAKPAVLFVRGAGWWAGDLDSHDRTARLCALKSGLPVCSVDYHCAPEAHFPQQRDEVICAVEWINAHGQRLDVDGRSILLWGESAGASLSVLAASRLRAIGNGSVKGLLLFYGNFEGPTDQTRAYSKWVWTQYLGTPWQQVTPQAVPLRNELAGLPPTWLGVGDEDPLLRDTLLMEQALKAAGVATTLRRYPGLPHGFVTMNRVFPGAVSAIEEAAVYVREYAGLA